MYKQVYEPITHILRTNGNPFGSFCTGENWNVEYKTNKNKIRCSAPTISQVLKWLREEKKIHIEIRLFVVGYGFDILTIDTKNKLGWSGTKEFDTYEECAMYGIKYVLDSFI